MVALVQQWVQLQFESALQAHSGLQRLAGENDFASAFAFAAVALSLTVAETEQIEAAEETCSDLW